MHPLARGKNRALVIQKSRGELHYRMKKVKLVKGTSEPTNPWPTTLHFLYCFTMKNQSRELRM